MDATGAVFFQAENGRPVFMGKATSISMPAKNADAGGRPAFLTEALTVAGTLTFDEFSRRTLTKIWARYRLGNYEFLRFQAKRKGKNGWRHMRPPQARTRR